MMEWSIAITITRAAAYRATTNDCLLSSAGVVASPNYEIRFEPTAAETGAVVAVFTGGAFVGAGLAGPSGDWLGRKLTVLIGSIIFLVGGILQTAAQNLGYLYAGRLLAGVGVGFLVRALPHFRRLAVCFTH